MSFVDSSYNDFANLRSDNRRNYHAINDVQSH